MEFLIGLGIIFAIIILSAFLNALTKSGIICAGLIGISILYFGNLKSLILLLIFYIISVLSDKLKKQKKDNDSKRDGIQVLANSLLGTLMLIVYYFSKNNIYLLAYACTVAASLSDTLASNIGTLSQKDPLDILSFKRIKSGMSGGVSITGILASIIGSIIIAICYSLLFEFAWYNLIMISIIGFAGSLFDSVFGSLIQVKYECIICNEITEKKTHCGEKTKWIRGYELVDNDIVNFLNNFVAILLALIIFY